MKRIDRKTHKIGDGNRYKSVTEKSQIIISFSLRKDDYHIKRLKHKEYGNTKKWNTFSITREGEIFEHYDPKYYSDFSGAKNVDKKSISIVLENMGTLTKSDETLYINWINEVCLDSCVVEKKWLGQKYWEMFSEKQIESTMHLCKKLCKQFDIPTKIIDFPQYHKDIVKFNGVVLKSNYFEDCNNINPLFDLMYFNELLNE